jgi:hypothetical protein
MTIKARYKFYFQLSDELLADEATKSQLYYTYSGAAPVQSVKAEPRYARYGKKAIMLLRGMILNRTFWFSAQEEADELWHTVLIPQLRLTVERTIQLQRGYQSKTEKLGIPLEPFERLFLQLDPYVFSFEDGSDFDVDLVIDTVQKIRRWLNDDTFDGSELVQIDIPPVDSNKPADQDTREVESSVSRERESTIIEPESKPELKSKPIDYTVWKLFFRDGSSQCFDAAQGQWIKQQVDEESAEH